MISATLTSVSPRSCISVLKSSRLPRMLCGSTIPCASNRGPPGPLDTKTSSQKHQSHWTSCSAATPTLPAYSNGRGGASSCGRGLATVTLTFLPSSSGGRILRTYTWVIDLGFWESVGGLGTRSCTERSSKTWKHRSSGTWNEFECEWGVRLTLSRSCAVMARLWMSCPFRATLRSSSPTHDDDDDEISSQLLKSFLSDTREKRNRDDETLTHHKHTDVWRDVIFHVIHFNFCLYRHFWAI